MKRLIAIVIVVAAAVAGWYCCVLPWRCNSAVAGVTASTERLMQQGEQPWRSASAAHGNLAALQMCEGICRDDVDGEMLAAANLRLLGRNDEAAAVYQHALRWDRRPELYLQLGVTQLALGQRDAGIRSLQTAVRFSSQVVNMVDDAEARAMLYRQIAEDESHRNLLRNERFDLRARNDTISYSGDGLGGDSPAARWKIYNKAPGTTSAELVPSPRGLALHIQTGSAHSGVEQVWATKDGGPAAVETTAWVFVTKGRVCLGSGKFETTDADAVSTTTGQWELLRSRSTRCPVAQTVIFSCDGGADFLITGVHASAIPDAPPCGEAAE